MRDILHRRQCARKVHQARIDLWTEVELIAGVTDEHTGTFQLLATAAGHWRRVRWVALASTTTTNTRALSSLIAVGSVLLASALAIREV